MSKINRFEKTNDISVNAVGFVKNEIPPLHITEARNAILWEHEQANGVRTMKKHSTVISCLDWFTRQDLSDEHVPYCSLHGPLTMSFLNSEKN